MTSNIKKQKDILISKINTVMLVIAALLLITCYITTRDKTSAGEFSIIEPTTVATLADGSTEYFLDTSDFDYHYTGILFYTSHHRVLGYSSGKQIYSFTKDGGIWTKSTGSKFHFIDINENMHFVSIIVNPVYDEVAGQNITFYIGSSYGMYNTILLDSMPRFFISLLIVLLSMVILAYYGMLHKKQQLSKELLYLGWFSFFCGVWSINETDAANLIFQNRILNSIIPYVCLMLVIPPFIMFFDSYLNIYSKVLRKIIIWASMLQFVVLTALHFLRIAEYRQTLVVMQVMLVLAVFYMIIGMIVQLINRRITKHIEICAVGLTGFLIAVIVDISQYYKATGDADRIGRYVFFLFTLILARDMIKDANEIIEKGRQVKQLEIFALTDSMTGLFNRNAFESHAKSGGNLEGLVAVVADANGLKHCNDTFGHEAGDEYITIVAEIFNEVYGKYGNCYRIGGDEFCCIIPANRNVNTERLKNLFMTKIYTANVNGEHEYKIGVAIGDATYDSSVDSDFRALVKRADAHMYENKRASKSS
ncbi:GGDEF domain-containing protein [Pseudobutyrivibrio sp.]